MHVVYYNSTFPPEGREPAEFLNAHAASHEWCAAAIAAGVDRITLLQRFHCSAQLDIDGVSCHFVGDGLPGNGSLLTPPKKSLEAIAALKPEVVHWNGPPFHLGRLRGLLAKSSAIVWQHHGGGLPPWYVHPVYRDAFRSVDVLFFSSRREAQRWREARIFGAAPSAMEILHASTRMESHPLRAARKELGIDGDPIILWVGDLDRKNDPLNVLKALPEVLALAPGARLYMLYDRAPLQDAVLKTIATLKLQEAATPVGHRPPGERGTWYSAADYFVVGSRGEGSGTPLLEALACGCLPVVPDIPVYRQITGHGAAGVLWKERTSHSCAAAFAGAFARERNRQAVRSYFKSRLSYRVLGENARRAYSLAYEARNGRPG